MLEEDRMKPAGLGRQVFAPKGTFCLSASVMPRSVHLLSLGWRSAQCDPPSARFRTRTIDEWLDASSGRLIAE
jgi:hypothetical protein